MDFHFIGWKIRLLDFLKFLNPKLVLPGQKALSNRILVNETKKFNLIRDQKLSSDEIGVTLAFEYLKTTYKSYTM